MFVQIIERSARKLLLKRGITATDYFKYCEEVGCDVWALLTSVKEALYEPAGFELIELPPCKIMVFQGEPYNDEDFMNAIDEVCKHIDKFNPSIYGYEWAPDSAPRFQLAPMGYRGYIEARPVKEL